MIRIVLAIVLPMAVAGTAHAQATSSPSANSSHAGRHHHFHHPPIDDFGTFGQPAESPYQGLLDPDPRDDDPGVEPRDHPEWAE